jgi:hypothetical protein
MKTILRVICIIFFLLVSACTFAAELWVYKHTTTAHYIGCTFTRDHYVGNLGQLNAFCPTPPIVTPRPVRLQRARPTPPNSIVWQYYISYQITVIDFGDGCYSPQGFQNNNNIYIKEIDCTF